MHDNHQVDPPGRPQDGYHLADDLSDKAVQFIQDAKVIDPDKPFFMYFAPQAGHAPHLVPDEWADKYKGVFDDGYEAIRDGILARQKELGLLPEDTELSPINPHGEPRRKGPDGQHWPLLDTVRPWDSLSDDEKRLFTRMAEVYAGYISYYDDRLGRILDHLEETGELDNTLIVAISDNGASGEGGPNGSFNEWRFFNGIADTAEETFKHIDELGTPASNNHYNTGWAWALDTPFPYWKRWAGYEGGTADMCLVAWPAKIKADGQVPRPVHPRGRRRADDLRTARHRAAGDDQRLPAEPDRRRELRRGIDRPRRARKEHAVLHDARPALDLPRGLAGLHDPPAAFGLGQVRAGRVGALPPREGPLTDQRTWPTTSPSACGELKNLWFYYAGIYNGLPLDDRSAIEQVLAERPTPAPPRDRYEFFPGASDVPESAGPRINGRSYKIAAGVNGRIGRRRRACSGRPAESPGGHSLYIKDGRLQVHLQLGRLDPPGRGRRRGDLTRAPHVYAAEFTVEGKSEDPKMPGAEGTLTLYCDDEAIGSEQDRHPAGRLLPDR